MDLFEKKANREYIVAKLERTELYDPFKCKTSEKWDNFISDITLRNMEVCKEFVSYYRIRSMDFSPSGEQLITGNGNRIDLYMTAKPRAIHSYQTKKRGCNIIKYYSCGEKVVHTTTKCGHDIQLLSLATSKYFAMYTGHRKRVQSISTPLLNDALLLSGSKDSTVRFWDIRCQYAYGRIDMPGPVMCMYHPSGLYLATAVDDCIQVYDSRYVFKGPLYRYMPNPTMHNLSGLKYSYDGRKLLVTYNNALHLFDSDNLLPIKQMTGFCRGEYVKIQASFTPDSNFVVTGGTGGSIHAYSTDCDNTIINLETITPNAIESVLFNPFYLMMVSASGTLRFWMPSCK
ncbi:WD repeat-containing protein 82-like [Teleopsis dalmanni]|uniref:WD repeat-containing protein 82-like n=1 Tax=Teleopsis dalmanni TaxID=139649 RepID=UPI0018CE3A0D|nr:WD repeat-containing protein 82-like [Teleopsis dalmanni]XP_037959751.1 WD repeat-containing protein 82-like [Teleopsis dalmanni]